MSVKRSRRSSPNAERIPKWPRVERPQFRHGAIRKMVLHNFLTFNDVEIHPSPQLNVIVGANGTGKSSLVCAMCLGLGGRPNLLGRAKQLKDFVKHGPAKEAYVEIMLHHGRGNHPTIRREIRKDTSTSRWFLNGRDKPESEIVEFIKQFDIQLDNKCQFLPQDKVVEFAKLDSFQLLEETEKAIGNDDMYKLHQQLKDLKTDRLDLQKRLENDQKEMDRLVRANTLLERDVTRLRTRQECVQKIKHLKWKKYWLEYEEARTAFNSCKLRRREAEKERRDLHRVFQPLIERLKEKEAVVKRFREKEDRCCRNVSATMKMVTDKHKELLGLQEDKNGASQELTGKVREEETRKEKIQQLEAEIQSFSSEMQALPSPESIQPQIATINRELQTIRQETIALQNQQQPLEDEKQHHTQQITAATEQLREIENVYNQRLAKLDQNDHQTYKAICWLDQNKSLFRKPIYNPVIVLLQIKNMKYAPQIEDFFMGKDAYSFVCETKEDYDVFGREVRDKLNLKVNMVVAPNERPENFRPSVTIQELRHYGFKHMLIDLVEAPPPVLAYFCRFHHLHNVPIADTANVDRFVSEQPSVQKFYVANDVYFAKRSHYSNKTITRSNHVKACRFFLSSVNEVAKATILADISEHEAAISDIDKRIAGLTVEEQRLRIRDKDARQNRNTLKESLNARSRLKRNVESRRIQLNQLSAAPIDLDLERSHYKKAVAKIFEKKGCCLVKIAEYLKAYRDLLVEQTCAHLDLVEADTRKKHYDEEKESVRNQLKLAEDEVESVKLQEVNSKDRAKEKLEVAKKRTGFNSPDEIARSGYADYFVKIFKDLPNEVQTIEESIHESQTQADLCGTSNTGENIIEQYEKRKQEIQNLEQKIQEDINELETHRNQTSELKEKWLVPLQKMIEDVNKRFSASFSLMGCSGEVSLAMHPTDYSKFGVEIRVKFRSEEELQLLNAQRQSGGERSVSTMMYLMALQDITSCPFRVVDEINQGMDSANERRVFNLIVDSVTRNHTSQYFMLTPKLLQDLKYTECVTIHAVHNGPELMPYNQWTH